MFKQKTKTGRWKQKRRTSMYKVSSLLVAVALVIVAGGSAYGEDWRVGEKWVYKHEGPRPHSDGSTMVNGDRTVEVTAIKGEGAERRYLLKTKWGKDDANPSTGYIDSKNMIHKIDVESFAILLFAPPIPAIWPLKPGEEKVLKTTMEVGGYSLPIEYAAKRLKDETITVPAGKFKKCRHVQVISSLQIEAGQTVKSKVDHWYHPKVKSLVKEVVITNYQSDNSYSATSLLKSHTKKD
jgi:hypothetical protein